MIEILDLSRFQPPHLVDYPTLAKAGGISAAIVKATDGRHSPDPAFAAHVAGCQAAGIACSAYHYLLVRHGTQDAVDQADEFIAQTYKSEGPARPSLRPCVDLEDQENLGRTPAQWIEAILRFVRRIDERLGVKPIVYTYPSFWKTLGNYLVKSTEPMVQTALAEVSECPLWWASYTGKDEPLPVPPPFKDWLLWQYTDKGVVPGYAGHVDRSRCLQGLDALLLPKATEATEATPVVADTEAGAA
jgi:lysozyme